MFRYFIKRLVGVIPTIVLVAVFIFGYVQVLPGDPARLAAGPEATAETVELVRKDLGLDQPMYKQFWRFVSGAVQGDFGTSIRTKRPVSTEIAERFMPTFWLSVWSMLWSVFFGFVIGVISALCSRHDPHADLLRGTGLAADGGR